MATLNRDRAFDMGSLDELLSQGKSILAQAVSISGRMEASISSISGTYQGIEGGYKEGALGADISRLSGKLRKDIYQDTMDHLEKMVTKLASDLPSYDSSIAQSVDGIREILASIKGRADELRGLLDAGDMGLSYPEFSQRLRDLKAGWDASAQDLAGLLAEIEGDMLGVAVAAIQYSRDPVNLSTGNFVMV